MSESTAPARPPAWEERWASRLFLALSPHLPNPPQPDPPPDLAPWESVRVPHARGALTATWFAAPAPARGAVLLLHPWVKWGKAYFLRGGRIEALRAAGYHTLTLDLAGFGGSSPRDGFFDRDVAAALAYMRQRVGDLPLHLWGLSSGGFWSHPALSGATEVAGAIFEDVSPHLLEWSWRMVPLLRPVYLFFRCIFPRAYRFLDIRRHAAAFRVAAVTYLSGEKDRGVRPAETRELAGCAGGRHLIVAGADHLGSFGQAREEVLALALDTFHRAEVQLADSATGWQGRRHLNPPQARGGRSRPARRRSTSNPPP